MKFCAPELKSMEFYGSVVYNKENSFMRNYKKTTKDDVPDELVCNRTIQNIAVVKFQLAGQVATQITRDIRVTLADYVSTFGNTVLNNGCYVLFIVSMK